ncbi:MAG: hypothetical protein H0X37_22450 [Herpetosiphonaceae bacterium]|nr:hypothetical protein [Herpetosiphonaceae bacterium]
MPKTAHNPSILTPRQEKTLSALLSHPTLKDAAHEAGVSLRQLHTWLKEPTFAESYRDLRREAVQQATARLQSVASPMVAVLVHVAASTSTPPATRVAAASKVLELAIKSVEIDDIVARLTALEQHK